MAGKGLFKMKRQMGRESEALSSAGSKQSAWSKLGMGLGGIAAMALTGGAATPLVAAMMAGGGTLAGGLLGRGLARGTKGGRMKGGRFYRDEAAKWKKDIGESIWSGAAKAGLQGGMGALAKGFSFGKEGLKFTSGAKGAGVNLADALGKDAPAMAGGYSDSLWGKFGKAIDFKGSFAGKGLGKLQSWQTGRAATRAGEQAKLTEHLGRMDEFATEFGAGGGKALPQGPSMVMKGDAPAFDAFDDPGQYSRRTQDAWLGGSTSTRELTGYGSGESYLDRVRKVEGPKDAYQNAEGLYSSSIPEPSASSGGVLSRDERGLYDTINKQTDAGYPPTWDKASGNYELSEEMGRGFIDKSGNIVRQPDRPDVPLDIGVDDFSMGDKDRLGSIEMIDTGEAYPGDTGLWDSPPSRGAESIPEGFRGGPKGDIRLKDKDLGSSLLERARGEASTRPTLNMQTGDRWQGNVLEPLSEGVTGSVTGTGQGVDRDIMGALMEGYNTPTGQGYDPGDEIFRQQNRGAFMDELALEKSLDSRSGRTFGLPSTTRGYDFRSVAGKRHRDTLDSIRWQNRLFGD